MNARQAYEALEYEASHRLDTYDEARILEDRLVQSELLRQKRSLETLQQAGYGAFRHCLKQQAVGACAAA